MMGVQHRRAADPFFWGLAAFLSLASDWLPKLLNLENPELTRLMVLGCALFFSGALVGCVRPERPWRWAVAAFIAYAVRDLVVLLNATGLRAVNVTGTIVFVIGHLGVYFLYACPVLAGAFLGASMMSAGLD
jgi:hypothetical protein